MNEIKNNLIFFKTQTAFEDALPNIADTSVAFIKDTRKIYTHGIYFDGADYSAIAASLQQYVNYQYLETYLHGYLRTIELENRVQTIIDAQTPKWSVMAEQISTLSENSVTKEELSRAIGSIEVTPQEITIQTIKTLLDEDTNREIAAKIILQVNDEQSNILLSADKIDLNGETNALRIFVQSMIDANLGNNEDFSNLYNRVSDLESWKNARGYLGANGVVFENIDNKNLVELSTLRGLYHYNSDNNRSSYWLKNDGSGQLGYTQSGSPAITWDETGVLTINNSYFPQSGGDGKYFDQAFKSTSTMDTPDLPGNDWPLNADSGTRTDGWAHFAQNTTGRNYVWMTTRETQHDGTPIGQWQGPWLITGPGGTAGEDGDGIQFVYTRATTADASLANLNSDYGLDAFQQNSFVPSGWNNYAQGVTKEWPYEFVGIRTKVDGVWSQYSGPTLWSHYGQNGTDGDGIEYIYYANSNGALDLTGNQLPENWPASQTAEYTGPTGSVWSDNPIDLTTLGPGSKEWVSVRKKSHETGLWGEFSAPVLWANYSRDGIADGYSIDLSNEVMPVATDSDGNVAPKEGRTYAYTNSTQVYAYHNGISHEISSITIGTIRMSDGSSLNSSNIVVSVSGNSVTVNIGTINDLAGKNIFIPIQVNFSGTEIVRDATITVYGVAMGEAGSSIELKTDVSAVHRDYNGTVVAPTAIELWCQEVQGDSGIKKYYPGEQAAAKGFAFEYFYDDNSSNVTSVSDNTITLQPSHDSITIRLKFNGNIIDVERIPYVKDGQQGITGASAVNYGISILQSSLVANPTTKKVSGTVKFKAFRQIGANNPVFINASPWVGGDNETLELHVASETLTITKDSDAVWTGTATNIGYTDTTQYAYVVIKSSVGTVRASTSIPFSISGAAGVAGNFVSIVFKRAPSKPAKPNDGSYSSPVPTGWSDGLPGYATGIDGTTPPIWMSKNTFYASNPTLTNWTEPEQVTSTSSQKIKFSNKETLAENENPDTAEGWYDVAVVYTDMIWMATKQIKDGVSGDWTIVRIKGEKGEKGDPGDTVVATIGGVVMRFNTWDSSAKYRNGTVPENGILFKDVVYYKSAWDGNTSRGNYYTVTTDNTNPGSPVRTSVNTIRSGWEMFIPASDSYFNNLIAENIGATNITAKQVIVTNNNNEVVAGMLNGTDIPSQIQGRTNPNGIRIFAGSVPATGDIRQTAFNVDEEGAVRAGSGAIEFNEDGSGKLAGGKISWNEDGSGTIANGAISWDADGVITGLHFSPQVGGSSLPDGSGSYKNTICITDIQIISNSDGVSDETEGNSVKIYFGGLAFKNGIFVKVFYFPVYAKYAKGTKILPEFRINANQVLFYAGDIIRLYYSQEPDLAALMFPNYNDDDVVYVTYTNSGYGTESKFCKCTLIDGDHYYSILVYKSVLSWSSTESWSDLKTIPSINIDSKPQEAPYEIMS